MKSIRNAAIVMLTLAGAMLVRTAVAADSARATPGPSVHAAARASHTATHAHATRAGHRAAHHRFARTRYGITAGDGRPTPLHPVGRGPERRAALPRIHRTVRDHGGSRSGHRTLATVPGLPTLLALDFTQLDPDQNQTMSCETGCVLAGRGPPAPAEPSSFPPSLAGGHPTLSASPAPTSATHHPGSTDAPPDRGLLRPASARVRPAFSYPITDLQEPLTGCSHPCRPEGAAGCCSMPSVGGNS
jgi:hypothetical protein